MVGIEITGVKERLMYHKEKVMKKLTGIVFAAAALVLLWNMKGMVVTLCKVAVVAMVVCALPLLYRHIRSWRALTRKMLRGQIIGMEGKFCCVSVNGVLFVFERDPRDTIPLTSGKFVGHFNMYTQTFRMESVA